MIIQYPAIATGVQCFLITDLLPGYVAEQKRREQ